MGKAQVISAEELKQAQSWVEANRETIPEVVYRVVTVVGFFNAELTATKQRATNLLAQFRQALGITPKSERGDYPRKPAKTDEEKLQELKHRRKKLLVQIRRYEDRLGKGRKKKAPKAKTEQDKPAARLERSNEPVFSGELGQASEEQRPLKVSRVDEFENPIGLHSVSDKRKRYEYSVLTKTIHLEVETVTDPRTGKSVTASTDDIGPPNSQATWGAIANTIISVIGYAIPANRLAKMLEPTCPYFTSQRICFYLKMSAELFEPIYTCLGGEVAESEILEGDDTKVRVIEIQNALKNQGELPEPAPGSLVEKIADNFGRVFDKKRGKGKKRSLNVSVVIGKTESQDRRSYIYFFRCHLGTLGDLLTKMLETRSPSRKQLTILSDLSTSNLVSDELYKKFEITHAGCAAHARRPFYRHRDKDQPLCYWMLSAFLVLEQIEDRIDELGRTIPRVLRYRERYSKKVWAAIKKRCEDVIAGRRTYSQYWPKTSELYLACQYIVKNYEALTQYLKDASLPSNNNTCERVLRWDKIMEDSSKFRMTEAGRLHVDILRTILHTCSAAEVSVKDYLHFVFKNRAAIAQDPGKYTPYAYALLQDAAKAAMQNSSTTTTPA